MVPALHNKRSDHDDLVEGDWSEAKFWLVSLAVVVTVAAVSIIGAIASARYGIEPRMPVIGFLLVAISAIATLGTYMITMIRNQMRAGYYLAVFWLIVLMALFSVFKIFG